MCVCCWRISAFIIDAVVIAELLLQWKRHRADVNGVDAVIVGAIVVVVMVSMLLLLVLLLWLLL